MDVKSNIGNGFILIFNDENPNNHFIGWNEWYSVMNKYELKDIIVNITANELQNKLRSNHHNNNNNDNNMNETFLVLNNTEINNKFFGEPIENALKEYKESLTESEYIEYAKSVALQNGQIQYGCALPGTIEGAVSLLHCKKSICSTLVSKWSNYIIFNTDISHERFYNIFKIYALPSCTKNFYVWIKKYQDVAKPNKLVLCSLNKRESVLMFVKFLLIFNSLSNYTENHRTQIKFAGYMVMILKIINILRFCHKKKLNQLEIDQTFELGQNFLDYCATFHREYVCVSIIYVCVTII